MLHFIRQGQDPHEVGHVVGQSEEMKPDGIAPEPLTGEPGPANRSLALLDPLFRRAPPAVEVDHTVGGPELENSYTLMGILMRPVMERDTAHPGVHDTDLIAQMGAFFPHPFHMSR